MNLSKEEKEKIEKVRTQAQEDCEDGTYRYGRTEEAAYAGGVADALEWILESMENPFYEESTDKGESE